MIAINSFEKAALQRLGARLAASRLLRKDRQGDFAARIGVSVPTYRKMEAGDPGVAIGFWLRALRLLGRLEDTEKLLAPAESIFAQLEQQTAAVRRKRAPRR